MILTIDRLIELLQDAKETIGGDKPIVLTSKKGEYRVVLDNGYPVDEQNRWSHFVAIGEPTTFSFSMDTAVKEVHMPKHTLEELTGEKAPETELSIIKRELGIK